MKRALAQANTERFRLLVLSPTGQIGGAEISVLNAVASLHRDDARFETHFLMAGEGPLRARAEALNCRVAVLPLPPGLASFGDAAIGSLAGSPFGRVRRLWGALPALWQLRSYIRRLRQEIDAADADIIHTNGFKMHALGIWANRTGRPVIWHVHDYAGLRPIMGMVLRRLAPRCTQAIVNSESVAQDLRSVCGRKPAIEVIYNTVDLERFSPNGPTMDLDAATGLASAPSGTVRIGLVGTMARWKGHEIFLEALSQLPADLPFRGYIIGGPVYQTQGSQYSLTELKGLASRLGLEGRVGFSGFVADPDKAMRSLDIVVHASTKPEPFGLVIIEAMACGRAVVASESGGAAEILKKAGPDAAIGCPPGDVEKLSQRIRRLVEDSELRASLGKGGRRCAEQYFGCDRLAGRFSGIYLGLVKKDAGRILFLNPIGQLGGAEISLLNLLASLRARRPEWAIRLISGCDGPLLARASRLGVETVALPFPPAIAQLGDLSNGRVPGFRTLASILLKWTFSLPQSAAYGWSLRREISEFNPHLIHTNGFKMHALGVLARVKGRPVVWHVRDYVSPRPIMGTVLKRLAGRCTRAIVNSESVAQDLRSVCGRKPAIEVIYNTVDLERFSPKGPTMDLDATTGLASAPPATVRIGLVGTMARWKGHEIFLEALSKLPADLPFRGYIIGGPVYQTQGSQYSLTELKGIASRLGLDGRVGFSGFVAEPDKAMRSLDIVVHASTKPEPFGLVIIEAMACGRAVVASESGGAAEILKKAGPDAAIGCPPGDVEKLSERIRQLVEDSKLRASLGRGGRRCAEQHFGCDRLAEELLTAYRNALATGRPQRSGTDAVRLRLADIT